jgi:hypothetical protein
MALFHRDTNSFGKSAGIGLFAAGLGAAITYYLYATPSGIVRRKKIKRFAVDVKNKSADAIDEITDQGKEIFDDTSDYLIEKYDTVKNLDKAEMTALGKKLKDHWQAIKGDIEDTVEKASNRSADRASEKIKKIS